MNPNLDTFSNWTAVANSVMALGVVLVNLWAVRHGPPTMVRLWAAVMALAAIYVTAYIVLAFTDIAPAEWSQVMRGVSLLAWPLVWCQSWWTTRSWLRLRQQITEVGGGDDL